MSDIFDVNYNGLPSWLDGNLYKIAEQVDDSIGYFDCDCGMSVKYALKDNINIVKCAHCDSEWAFINGKQESGFANDLVALLDNDHDMVKEAQIFGGLRNMWSGVWGTIYGIIVNGMRYAVGSPYMRMVLTGLATDLSKVGYGNLTSIYKADKDKFYQIIIDKAAIRLKAHKALMTKKDANVVREFAALVKNYTNKDLMGVPKITAPVKKDTKKEEKPAVKEDKPVGEVKTPQDAKADEIAAKMAVPPAVGVDDKPGYGGVLDVAHKIILDNINKQFADICIDHGKEFDFNKEAGTSHHGMVFLVPNVSSLQVLIADIFDEGNIRRIAYIGRGSKSNLLNFDDVVTLVTDLSSKNKLTINQQTKSVIGWISSKLEDKPTCPICGSDDYTDDKGQHKCKFCGNVWGDAEADKVDDKSKTQVDDDDIIKRCKYCGHERGKDSNGNWEIFCGCGQRFDDYKKVSKACLTIINGNVLIKI